MRGSVLSERRREYVEAARAVGARGTLAVLGVNLLGDGLRDVLDPRTR